MKDTVSLEPEGKNLRIRSLLLFLMLLTKILLKKLKMFLL